VHHSTAREFGGAIAPDYLHEAVLKPDSLLLFN
jgi:hypothetical protein